MMNASYDIIAALFGLSVIGFFIGIIYFQEILTFKINLLLRFSTQHTRLLIREKWFRQTTKSIEATSLATQFDYLGSAIPATISDVPKKRKRNRSKKKPTLVPGASKPIPPTPVQKSGAVSSTKPRVKKLPKSI